MSKVTFVYSTAWYPWNCVSEVSKCSYSQIPIRPAGVLIWLFATRQDWASQGKNSDYTIKDLNGPVDCGSLLSEMTWISTHCRRNYSIYAMHKHIYPMKHLIFTSQSPNPFCHLAAQRGRYDYRPHSHHLHDRHISRLETVVWWPLLADQNRISKIVWGHVIVTFVILCVSRLTEMIFYYSHAPVHWVIKIIWAIIHNHASHTLSQTYPYTNTKCISIMIIQLGQYVYQV